MCGIAGIVTSGAPPDAARLNTLIGAMAHRGPDGLGETIDGPAALAHNRLAIIDLPGGDQPFYLNGAALIANGEIYNYRELRAEMRGTHFASNSDCEPPLHLWQKDPNGFTARLRGMYAIAIRDGQDAVTLARDPFGIKPLYIAAVPGGTAFASEPRALLAAGVARSVDRRALSELLHLQFTTGRNTIFPGITRVLPGEHGRITANGFTAEGRLQAVPDGGPEAITEDAALKRLDAALMDSVALHCRSDVPYGMFLSGGIDSATVLACMARLESHPLAFTAGFDVPGAADERAQAASTARAAGARHESIEVTEAEMWRHLPAIVACMDDPAADYAIIPTWFLARRARQDVKVVLSGEGGDEILAGYGRYRKAARPWWLGGRAMRLRGNLDGLGVLRPGMPDWRPGWRHTIEETAKGGCTRLQAAQASDLAEWLPNDLLIKLDRCLMAHSVEGRTPFLDRAVAEASWRLPDALKVRDGRGKYLLRAWLAGALPEARPFAPKQGFTVPVGAWIAQKGEKLGPLVASSPGVAEIAHPDRVRALFARASGRREGPAAWTLLFYALWHRAHIEARPVDGDVFEILAHS